MLTREDAPYSLTTFVDDLKPNERIGSLTASYFELPQSNIDGAGASRGEGVLRISMSGFSIIRAASSSRTTPLALRSVTVPRSAFLNSLEDPIGRKGLGGEGAMERTSISHYIYLLKPAEVYVFKISSEVGKGHPE